MDAPAPKAPKSHFDEGYALNDNLRRTSGRVYLTGTQAIVRMLLDQARLDRTNGVDTAGFVSGYRGSPLGAVDQQLWRAAREIEEHGIQFLPAINEDLAATACLGSQRAGADPKRRHEGVFALWYGKGPGVDRAGDALKHGNAYGSTPRGGVLVVAGDDHGCVSSSMSHQSDQAFQAWSMPIVSPANIQDYLRFGLYGWALSRFSGAWVGFKAISEIVESAASVDIPPLPSFETPDYTPPAGGLHYRWPDYPSPQIEQRLLAKLDAVRAFARVNSIDDILSDPDKADLAILTSGKAHGDALEALRLLGLNLDALKDNGIRLYKIGLSFPLEPTRLRHVLRGVRHVLVIEEKGGVVESQLKDMAYNWPLKQRPTISGKTDQDGQALIERVLELRPSRLIPPLIQWLQPHKPHLELEERVEALPKPEDVHSAADAIKRIPYFCSGCPHNTSTRVPEGSRALAGIGCHFMANWMERSTEGLTQMGGEGVDWVAQSLFSDEPHVFQNLGDGTYYHSGFMAVRQAIAAKTNITYKILFNDAVAMTGGQPVEGQMTVPQIAAEMLTEGVKEAVVVTDEPEKYAGVTLPAGVSVHHRHELDPVQRRLRDIKGVTVLIYDQTCAAEKRRRRKKGEFPDPDRRIFINQEVCEGCGDCGVKSNCLSILPVETELGRKRMIDQSSCNKDYSCVEGFCPSFVSVSGAKLRKASAVKLDEAAIAKELAALPTPQISDLSTPYDLMFTGIGGTGVVTVAALVTMAAHLEGKGASQLDFMGFAQKGGAVLSFVRIGDKPEALNQVRIDEAQADGLIACDTLVAANTDALKTLSKNTRALINDHETPTGDFTRQPDFTLHNKMLVDKLRRAAGDSICIDAIAAARRLLGDTIGANVFLLGYGWQMGLVPVSLEALHRAIELNGVAVKANKRALALGRLAAAGSNLVEDKPRFTAPQTVDDLVADRMARLTSYQSAAYAERYKATLAPLLALGDEALSKAAARYLYKLMAYKDEYEVARLYTDGSFIKSLQQTFEDGAHLKFHLAPPLLAKKRPGSDEPQKMTFGPWMMRAFKLLAKLKGLRGTAFDIFGYTAERKAERALISQYENDINVAVHHYKNAAQKDLIELLEIPEHIRGYGPIKERAMKAAADKRFAVLARIENPGVKEKAA